MTGRSPVFVHPDDGRHKYFVTGSVVGFVEHHATVWGAGVLHSTDPVSRTARYLAVRGPLTRAHVTANGGSCPEVFGDPALLLPRLIQPTTPRRPGRVGLVPHFADGPRLHGAALPENIHLIDIQRGIRHVVDEVASCDVVASSSLHGLIVSHAYGVPAAWVRFPGRDRGEAFKFEDYYAALGIPAPRPLLFECDRVEPHAVEDAAHLPDGIDVRPLLDACPFPVT